MNKLLAIGLLLTLQGTAPAWAADLTAPAAQDAAIMILLGDPYGATVDEVKRNIKRQERVGRDDPDCSADAWKFRIEVEPSEHQSDGISGFLCLSPKTGKMLSAGLPYLE